MIYIYSWTYILVILYKLVNQYKHVVLMPWHMLALYGTVMFPPTNLSPRFRADRSAGDDVFRSPRKSWILKVRNHATQWIVQLSH